MKRTLAHAFGLVFIIVFCLALSGCAEFLEDYQYNPAGPLYTSGSGT